MVSRRLLRRVAKAASALAPPVASAPPVTDDESGELAREIGEAFGQMVRHYERQYGLTHEEARERASAMPDGRLDVALGTPAEDLTWSDLGIIANDDPDAALARWQEVKRAALAELRDGHRAARALETAAGRCRDRAEFLALRDEVLESLGSHTPLERLLVDQLALWQTLLWRWQETVTFYTLLAGDGGRRVLRHDGPFESPRLADADALQRAERTVERLHRLYLRTLAALRARGRSPRVVVRRAGQVNVARQQVNLTCGAPADAG